ncbi:hypothetical protein DBR32_04950 [Taibaiella sp. KBW10]|uniref:T9SS type A sorting domain-containing protein n=1 Tax=Taibaiella sp. KBW10 TaxID=2153357 RepID=UPI000F593B98|nr:T9SS type A sorting domain-containing protein [Taibaiella sp. KBW10]RQO31314.1 hypothetical protein DBR32_04950 [Taibaiella sp. KBW10]
MKLLYKIFLLAMLPLGFMVQDVKAQNVEQQRTLSTSDKKMIAYPIPANSAVYFKISVALRNEAKTVELVNVIGKTVAIQNINADGNDIVFGGLNQLPEGIYIGVMKNTEGKIIQTTKLMIQH